LVPQITRERQCNRHDATFIRRKLRRHIIKILFVISNSFISGISVYLRNLLQGLDLRDEKYVFVTGYDGVMEKEFKKYANTVISITTKTEKEKMDILNRYLVNDFDILHVIESWDGYRLLLHFDRKAIVTMFGDYRRHNGYFKKRIKFLKGLRTRPIIVTDNKRNLDLFPDIFLIPNGVFDTDRNYTRHGWRNAVSG